MHVVVIYMNMDMCFCNCADNSVGCYTSGSVLIKSEDVQGMSFPRGTFNQPPADTCTTYCKSPQDHLKFYGAALASVKV